MQFSIAEDKFSLLSLGLVVGVVGEVVLDKVAEVVEMVGVVFIGPEESMVVGMSEHWHAPAHWQLASLGCLLHWTIWSSRVEMDRKAF